MTFLQLVNWLFRVRNAYKSIYYNDETSLPANIWKWYLSCIWFEFEYIIFYSNMSQNQIMCKNAWFDFDLYLNEISLLKYESNSSHPFKLHDLKLTLFWLKILHSNKSQIPIIPKNCMMWNWLVIASHFEWAN